MVQLINVDPGHHHASLVQRQMYPQVDPVVHVYAPGGEDLDGYMTRVEGFNTRPENPTRWVEKVYAGPDFFERMLREHPGNLVILAGNNTRKTTYILGCVKAGLNVLADKPMAINPEQYTMLVEAFKVAEEKGVLLYDIMTERYEVTTMLQRELSRVPEVFGELEPGTIEQPAVTKESVHHFSKQVAGKPLIRPAWFYDVRQEGEGIVDVTTHLVDLVQWECFPEQVLSTRDVKLLSAHRSSTPVTPAQFKLTTGLDDYPGFLQKDVQDGVLQVYGNGEMLYTLKGHVAKVSVRWNFESPGGGGDTHYSIMRGTQANLIIEQGQAQGYKPALYVERQAGLAGPAFETALQATVDRLTPAYPGITLKKGSNRWEIVIPEALRTNHEQHFGQVTDKFLGFLAAGHMPSWEAPNMIVKYYTIMEAYKASR
jgi:predicted dehydrogenase